MMRRSRSVFEPFVRPLCDTFEDAGVAGALQRLTAQVETVTGPLGIPRWVWDLDFFQAVAACTQAADANAWTRTFCAVAQRFNGNACTTRTVVDTACDEIKTATVRLCYGAMLEAFASHCAAGIVPKDQAAGGDINQKQLAMLYSDAYCVAVWTSAHAEYMASAEELASSNAVPKDAKVRDLMVPPPELYSVLNLSNLLHLGPLYDRIASPKCCSKSSQTLLAILSRVTNAGSRGWESTLLATLKDSEGAVRVCTQSLGVALSGMHPALHPAARKPWRERFVLLRALRAQTHAGFKDVIHKASGAVKEAIRLHLAGVLLADCATLDALHHTRQPAGQLLIPPTALPHASLAAAMQSMVEAGAMMLTERVSAAVAIQRNLTSEPRSRRKSTPSTGARHATQEPEALAYSSAWLGGRSGPAGSVLRPAAQVVSGLFSAAYRSIYIPFWLHGNHHGHRASRLDSAQYAALHHLSPAYKLCAQLPMSDFCKAQKLAFEVPCSALLSVSQACKLLGIAPSPTETPGLPCSASSKAAQEAEIDVMSLSAHDAALLFAFTRIATLRASILSYDLGPATRRKQALAVCQRMLLTLAPDEDPVVTVKTRLPKHACTLFCCSECRRVVNSVQDGSGKDVPFNELGLSASMLLIDGAITEGHMRCAKRSSAALRTAVALEASAEKLQLEQLDPVSEPLLPRDLRPATIVTTMCTNKAGKRKLASAEAARDSSSEVAKFRRDLKSCYEQSFQATSCGDVPLVQIPILGRVVRIFGQWHALCAMCGCMTRVSPASRFGSEICCLRCDFAMLAGQAAADEMRAALPKPLPPSCRFCGKVEPENGTGIKWRRIPSPADTGGRNASVPAPLRVCWCARARGQTALQPRPLCIKSRAHTHTHTHTHTLPKPGTARRTTGPGS